MHDGKPTLKVESKIEKSVTPTMRSHSSLAKRYVQSLREDVDQKLLSYQETP